jgi:hypothetical protein
MLRTLVKILSIAHMPETEVGAGAGRADDRCSNTANDICHDEASMPTTPARNRKLWYRRD